jgi:hypothetical protein
MAIGFIIAKTMERLKSLFTNVMEQLFYYLIGLIVVNFALLRYMFIKGLADDWNPELTIYIESLKNNPAVTRQTVAWVEKRIIKKWHYYFRLNVWSINKIVNDPFLIQEIHNRIQDKYIIK